MLYKNKRTGIRNIYWLDPETVQRLYAAGVYTSSLYSAQNAGIRGMYNIPVQSIENPIEEVRGILDDYPGAAFAAAPDTLIYSSYTGPTVRVRRDSDNAERDFTAEEVSNGDLVLWVGNSDLDSVPPTPSTPVDPADYPDFRILVNTANAGVSNSDQFNFTGALGDYDVEVWDSTGTTLLETITGLSNAATITIAAGAGTYELRVYAAATNGFNQISFSNGGDKDKLIEVRNWGNIVWSSIANMFYGCSNLTSITSIVTPDLSNVTVAASFARNCTSLTTLDVSNWNTTNITNIVYFVAGCSSLTTLDVSNWNTSNVTTFFSFVRSCTNLTALDVSNWNTSKVESFGSFAISCGSLTTLDVSNWNTSNVTNFEGFARLCPNLTDIIGIENFDISSVTVFGLWLQGTTLPTSRYDQLLIKYEAQAPNTGLSFNAGNSTYTAGGAAEAARYNLINTYGWTITDGGFIDLSDFRIVVDTTQSGVSASDQFNFTGASGDYDVEVYDQTGTTLLETITGLSGAATITIAAGSGTYELRVYAAETNGFNEIRFNNAGDKDKLIEVRNWGDIEWRTMNSSFRGCTNLVSITSFVLPNTSNVTDMRLFASGCTSLTTFNVSNWDVSTVQEFVLFAFLVPATTIDVSNWNVSSSATSFNSFIRNCPNLTILDVTNWNTENVTDFQLFASGSTSLLDIPGIENFDIGSVTIIDNFLTGVRLPTSRYDALLINYAAQAPNPNLSFSGGNSKYTAGGAAEAARNNLINTYGWTITDGGNPNGYVTTLYDQSGNSNHATQGTAANQPKIVDAGSLVVENGKAALDFDGSNDSFNLSSSLSALATSEMNSFEVVTTQTGNKTVGLGAIVGPGPYSVLGQGSTTYIANRSLTKLIANRFYGQQLFAMDTKNLNGWQNGNTINYTSTLTVNRNTDFTAIGRVGSLHSQMKMQVAIYYTSDQSTNRPGIETAINNEYNIY